MLNPVFNFFHSETKLMRYIRKLDNKDFDLILESINSALELKLSQPIRDEIDGKKLETEIRSTYELNPAMLMG